jgi:hypothetical protein
VSVRNESTGDWYGNHATLESGIAFEPGEEIILAGGKGTTLAGYFVDL